MARSHWLIFVMRGQIGSCILTNTSRGFFHSPVSVCQISGLSGVNIPHVSEVCLGAHQHDIRAVAVRVGLQLT